MDLLNQRRFAIWTIVLLVVLNIVSISLLWMNQSKHSPGHPPLSRPRQSVKALQFIQSELDLTEEQVKQYEILRNRHREDVGILLNDIRRLKKEMMDEIFFNETDSVRARQYAEMIGHKQAEVERITFNHFLALKKLCGDDKKDKLQGLVREFFRMNPPPDRRHPLQPNRHRMRNPPPRKIRN